MSTLSCQVKLSKFMCFSIKSTLKLSFLFGGILNQTGSQTDFQQKMTTMNEALCGWISTGSSTLHSFASRPPAISVIQVFRHFMLLSMSINRFYRTLSDLTWMNGNKAPCTSDNKKMEFVFMSELFFLGCKASWLRLNSPVTRASLSLFYPTAFTSNYKPCTLSHRQNCECVGDWYFSVIQQTPFDTKNNQFEIKIKKADVSHRTFWPLVPNKKILH